MPSDPSARSLHRLLKVALTLSAFAAPALAQQQATRLQTRIEANALFSDDMNAEPGRDRGALFSLVPGLSLISRGAELRGSVDYSMTLVRPWRTEQHPDSLQHALNAQMQYAQQGGGFAFDARAGVGRQARSAFGIQRPSNGQVRLDENQREIYTLNLAPSWSSRIGDRLQFGVSHRVQATNVRDSLVGDSTLQTTSLQLGPASRAALAWGLGYTDARVSPRLTRDTRTQSAFGSLSWRPDIDWDFGASVGHQRSDLRGPLTQEGATYGLSARWRPTPRSLLAASADHNVYGNTHSLSLEHRFARASLRLQEVRSVQNPGVAGAAVALTNYELMFAQLASIEPDPLLRDQMVRAQLQQLGLSPDAVALTGFLTSRPTLSRQRLIGAAWQTQRSNWAMTLSRSDSERFAPTLEGFDDFADSRQVSSEGLSLSASYRLTPVAGLSGVLQWQRNQGDLASQRTELQSATLSWNTRLGRAQQLSLSLRHSNYEAPTRSYEENSLLLSFQQTFR